MQAAAWTKATTTGGWVRGRAFLHPNARAPARGIQPFPCVSLPSAGALKAAGGKLVVEVGGQRILLAEVDGSVFAVSNKCSHLGLPLVGKVRLGAKYARCSLHADGCMQVPRAPAPP